MHPGTVFFNSLAISQMHGMHFLAPPKAAMMQPIPKVAAQAAIAPPIIRILIKIFYLPTAAAHGRHLSKLYSFMHFSLAQFPKATA